MRKRKKPHSLFELCIHANRKFRKAFHRTTRPSRGMKEKAMNMAGYFSSLWLPRDRTVSHRTNVLARVGLTALAVVSVAVLLSACGGGGGGGTTATNPPTGTTPPTETPVTPPTTPPVTPPTTPPQASGTVAPTNCEIPGDAGSCNGRASILNLANASNVTLVVGEGTTASTIPVSGNGEVMVPLSGERVEKLTLKAGDGTVLDSGKTVASNCSPGSAWDTALGEGRCSVKLCYDEAVVSTTGTDGTPHLISLTGRERAKNMTDIPDSWEASGYRRRYSSCGMGTVDSFGRLPYVCNEQNGDFADPLAYNWRYFYLNPIAGTFHRYKEGSSPATSPAPDGFVFSDEYSPTLPTGWGNATTSAKNAGRFYVYGGGDAGSMFDLWFLKDGRPESERQLVFAGTTGAQGTGSFRVLRTVKHTCTSAQ